MLQNRSLRRKLQLPFRLQRPGTNGQRQVRRNQNPSARESQEHDSVPESQPRKYAGNHSGNEAD